MKKFVAVLVAVFSVHAVALAKDAKAGDAKGADAKAGDMKGGGDMKKGGEMKGGDMKPADTRGTETAAAAPSDAQIAAIVVAANEVDVDAGKLAEKETKNDEVKAFAKQMVTDHTAVNKQAGDLVKKLKVKPEENDTSKALKQGGKENEAALKKLKGADFDKAYVDHEVAYHVQVLDAIDKVLLPNAKNAELKGLIEKVRPAIAAHLEHAKNLQTKMASGGK